MLTQDQGSINSPIALENTNPVHDYFKQQQDTKIQNYETREKSLIPKLTHFLLKLLPKKEGEQNCQGKF